jgi:hypothetical protein
MEGWKKELEDWKIGENKLIPSLNKNVTLPLTP